MKFPNIDKCVDNLLNGIELEAILYKYIGIYHYKIKRYNTSREGKCWTRWRSLLMDIGYLSYVKTSSNTKRTVKVT